MLPTNQCNDNSMISISLPDLEEVLGERKDGYGTVLLVAEKVTSRIVATRLLAPAPAIRSSPVALPILRLLGESMLGQTQYSLIELIDGGKVSTQQVVSPQQLCEQLLASSPARSDRRRRRSAWGRRSDSEQQMQPQGRQRRSPAGRGTTVSRQESSPVELPASGIRSVANNVPSTTLSNPSDIVSTATPSTTRHNPRQVYQTKSTSYYMEPGDPNPVLIAPLLPDGLTVDVRALNVEAASNSSARAAIKIALVSMVKNPSNFSTWLDYHHRVLGVQRFYIKIEDTPELSALLAAPPWDLRVEATFVSSTQRDYFEQMDRQSSHIAAVIPLAREAGYTHLLHIDDDELIFCSRGVDELLDHVAISSAKQPDLHMLNVEALLPSPNCSNPFRECRAFRHFPTKYCSYTNGKSFAHLGANGLRAHGPHHFRCATGAGGANSAVTQKIPPHVACVLHFESATFGRWRDKYLSLARRHGTSPEIFAKVPFKYYRESLVAALAIVRAEAGGDVLAIQEAEEAAMRLWCRWKLAPEGLPAAGSSPIILADGVTVLDPFCHELLVPEAAIEAAACLPRPASAA
mmetsp:Transcript_48360/g.80200  ORF Transcript_48360/g.80200 Transcript_48360/m.80200 type:complete len:576 (+) Transcript_48360:175-1902(+)